MTAPKRSWTRRRWASALSRVRGENEVIRPLTPTPNPSPIKREGLLYAKLEVLSSPSVLVGEGAGGWGIKHMQSVADKPNNPPNI